MRCPEPEQLHAFASGLDPTSAGVAEHLATCAACAARLAAARHLDDLLDARTRQFDDHHAARRRALLAELAARETAGRAHALPGWMRSPLQWAAVLVIAVALSGVWLSRREPGYSHTELTTALADVQRILAHTADAVDTLDRATVDAVLGGPVGPALRRFPIRWPDAEGTGS